MARERHGVISKVMLRTIMVAGCEIFKIRAVDGAIALTATARSRCFARFQLTNGSRVPLLRKFAC
jgi:hypothetical protein